LKFCNDLSSNYFEISKDVLYCERRDSERRKAKMKVLLHLLECIIEVIYPILPHLSEEAYQSSKLLRDKFLEKSISLVNFPSYENLPKINESEIAFVESLLSIKQSIYKELELSRKKGTIESNSQAEVEIRCTELTNEFLKKMDGINPESFFLVSNVNFLQSDTISESIKVEKTKKNKCKRC
jgi:isoleucyl-tRNA synthetase